jgi:hypothetical protein
MALTLDRSGSAKANYVRRERTSVNTTKCTEGLYLFVQEVLFYTKGFTLEYLDEHGDLWPLFYGKDYVFALEQHAFSGKNHVAGQICVMNFTLKGQLLINYHAVGGQWRLNRAQVAQHVHENKDIAVDQHRQLVFTPHLYAAGEPLRMYRWEHLVAAQKQCPYGVFIGIETMTTTPEVLVYKNKQVRKNQRRQYFHEAFHATKLGNLWRRVGRWYRDKYWK